MKPRDKFHKPVWYQFIYIVYESVTSQKTTFFLQASLFIRFPKKLILFQKVKGKTYFYKISVCKISQKLCLVFYILKIYWYHVKIGILRCSMMKDLWLLWASFQVLESISLSRGMLRISSSHTLHILFKWNPFLHDKVSAWWALASGI